MTQPQWETIQLQNNDNLSPFLKWGDTIGQSITAVVLDYTPDGGRDYDGNPCQRIELQITQPGGYTIKDGMRLDLNPGDKLTWQASTPARMVNGLREAHPERGDLLQLTYAGTYKTDKGTGKDIQIQIARGAGHQYLQPQAVATGVAESLTMPQAQPPF